MGIILTTYLPTMCLLIIFLSTHYFKPHYFEANVTVNLTGMLVMVTLYIGTSKSLPDTSYTKMIEIWMLFCLVFSFCEVLLHTFTEFVREDDDRLINHSGERMVKQSGETKAIKIKVRPLLEDEDEPIEKDSKMLYYMEKIGKVGMPLILAFFAIPYFIFGTYISYVEPENM